MAAVVGITASFPCPDRVGIREGGGEKEKERERGRQRYREREIDR